jgi:hypothetical protein
MHPRDRPGLGAFAEGTPVAEGQPVIRTLREIEEYIATDVVPPLRRFL